MKTETFLLSLGLLLCHLVVDLEAAKKWVLVGSRTNYFTARNYLAELDYKPSSFGSSETLDQVSSQLKLEGYEPHVFYLIGRHSIRYPDADLMSEHEANLARIQAQLAEQLKRRSPRRSHSVDWFKLQLEELVRWRPRWSVDDASQTTNRGVIENISIVRHLKSIYPEFFDNNKSKLKFAFTSRLRTAQTGMDFLREVDHLKLTGCDVHRDDSPILHDLEHSQVNLHCSRDPCARQLIKDFYWPNLEFQIQCKIIYGSKFPIREEFIRKIRALTGQLDSIKSKLNLREFKREGPEKRDLLETIFDVCKFESAIYGTSIWCSVIDQEVFNRIDYIKDAETYYKDAYGPEARARQACPVAKHLIETLQDSIQLIGSNKSTKESSSSSSKNPTKTKATHLYFTHSDAMKKLIAAFKLFKEPSGYTEQEVNRFLETGQIPNRRDWLTSLILPFSANLVFVLYAKTELEPEIGAQSQKLKVLVSLNEIPVKLDGCSELACDWSQFLDNYSYLLDCDLHEICKPPADRPAGDSSTQQGSHLSGSASFESQSSFSSVDSFSSQRSLTPSTSFA